MKRRMNRLLLAGVLAVAAAGSLTAAAQAGPAAPELPEGLDPVPVGHKVFLVGHATGVQIYRCTVTADDYAWGFVAPRADLYDNQGKLLTTHYGGPTWEARDGSTVKAARVDGVTVDPDAIPSRDRQARLWLETARAYAQRHDYTGALHTLQRATAASTESMRCHPLSRGLAAELVTSGGRLIQQDARSLASQLGE